MFGDLLRRHRRSAGLTQAELSALSGVATDAISSLEGGRRYPRPETITRLAAALRLSPEQRDELVTAADRRQRRSHGGATAAPVRETFELPAATAGFSGRTQELDRLAESATAERAVVVIDGMPGVGKTALAVQAMHLQRRHAEVVVYLDLRGYSTEQEPLTPSAALAELLRMIGFGDSAIPAGLAERTAAWRSALAGRRSLVVLDNASSARQVQPLLPGAGSYLVLVTSRQRLPELAGVEALTLCVPPPADAATMLMSSAELAGPVDHAAVQEIVDLCGRLPLALRIVAARLRHRSAWQVADLVGLLRDETRRLTALTAQERSVAAVFSLSYRQLAPAHRRLFRLLSAIPGPDFDAGAVAAITELPVRDAWRILEDLLDGNLVQQAVADRYHLHDLVRAFAVAVRADDPAAEISEAQVRLLGYYRARVVQMMDGVAPAQRFKSPDAAPREETDLDAGPVEDTSYDRTQAASALAWLDAERANLLAAVRFAVQSGRHELATDLAILLWPYLDLRGHYDDALSMHALAISAAQSLGDEIQRGYALFAEGLAFWRIGQYVDALSNLQVALELSRRQHCEDLEGQVRHGLGMVCWQIGRSGEAATHYRETVAIGRRLANENLVGRGHYGLGMCHWRADRLHEALASLRKAAVLLAEPADPTIQGYAAHGLGLVLWRLDRDAEARAQLERCRSLAKTAGNRDLEGYALHALAAVELRAGEITSAQARLEEALAISEITGERTLEGNAVHGLGQAALRRGDVAAARRYGDRALAVARSNHNRDLECEVLNTLGEAAGEPDEARAYHRQARALAVEVGNGAELARADAALALLS
ncbi:ATP-binding protein [Kribbella deserti]|uniref:Tetratricopeptide repeat protein n=1 Tax=Kribbella deserti TaxID=1926257 RepID=A0ABV6QET7_9ACTN